MTKPILKKDGTSIRIQTASSALPIRAGNLAGVGNADGQPGGFADAARHAANATITQTHLHNRVRAIQNEDGALRNGGINIEHIVRVGSGVRRRVVSTPVVVVGSKTGAVARRIRIPAGSIPAESRPLGAVAVVGVDPAVSWANDRLARAAIAQSDQTSQFPIRSPVITVFEVPLGMEVRMLPWPLGLNTITFPA